MNLRFNQLDDLGGERTILVSVKEIISFSFRVNNFVRSILSNLDSESKNFHFSFFSKNMSLSFSITDEFICKFNPFCLCSSCSGLNRFNCGFFSNISKMMDSSTGSSLGSDNIISNLYFFSSSSLLNKFNISSSSGFDSNQISGSFGFDSCSSCFSFSSDISIPV